MARVRRVSAKFEGELLEEQCVQALIQSLEMSLA